MGGVPGGDGWGGFFAVGGMSLSGRSAAFPVVGFTWRMCLAVMGTGRGDGRRDRKEGGGM